MREVKVWKDPYDCNMRLCKAKTVSFEPGLTVLVGCNGAGKTTMLLNIEEELNEQKIPVVKFDNLKDGSDNMMRSSAAKGDFEIVAQIYSASEGEGINIAVNNFLKNKLEHFLITGKEKVEGFKRIFYSEEELAYAETPSDCKERWILMDATDSGLSIDNICNLKEMMSNVINELNENGIETYFIVSANEYEMASNEDCLDVISGKHLRFDEYIDFKYFILNSKEQKMKRYQKKTRKTKEKS